MIVAIHQPNFAPWLGYFRKVVEADVFVFYDNVQMPMGKSLVTRNRFKSPQGPIWLTVPSVKSGTPCMIRDTCIAGGNWSRKHIASLRNWYAGSEWLEPVCDILEGAYADEPDFISALNSAIIKGISRYAGIAHTRFVTASEMSHGISGAGSIIPILRELGATEYLTGQGAGSMRHLDVDALSASGIGTRFLSTDFRTYPQKHGDFEENLSAIDALLNVGPEGLLDLLRG